jgi:methanogenic corrinoid protein MtbC1
VSRLQKHELRKYSSEYLRLVLNRARGSALSLMSDLAGSKSFSLLDIFTILVKSQETVGMMWAKGTITVADEHFATETTLDAIDLVSDKMKKYIREKKGSALLANLIEGEFHRVGLKMFAELLRSEGWEVEYYSSSLSIAQLFKYLEKTGKTFHLICISLTMGFNLPELQSLLKILRTNIWTKNSKIIIGSTLFKQKKVGDALIDKETGVYLADLLATNFEQGLKFIRKDASVVS